MIANNIPTEEQIKIIEYNGDLLVTAVPGSGKTKTIIDKVEKLAREIINKNIIVVTYTYRAAYEVSERLSKRNINNNCVWSGTIHKFCLDFIINKNLNLLPELCKGYDIVDEDDIDKIMNECANQLDIAIDRNMKPNLSLNIDGAIVEDNISYQPLVTRIYEYLKENRMISFDLILYYAYKILSENPHIATNIANGTAWIIVDEFQDTKELQYQIVSKISLNNSNLKLMFVGDPNQAIYTNLGGVVKSKNELEVLMQRKFKEKHLTGCFRSNQRIIDFYNCFACCPENIVSRNLFHTSPTVQYYKNINVEAESFGNFAKIFIDEFHMSGINYPDICVALPWGVHLMHLSSWFLKNASYIPIDSPIITPLKKMDDGIWNNIVRLLFVSISYSNIFYYERMLKYSLRELGERFGIDCEEKTEKLLDYFLSKDFKDDAIATQIIKQESAVIFNEIIGLSENQYMTYIGFLTEATKSKIQRYPRQLENTFRCFKQCYKSKDGVVFSTFHGCKGEEYQAVIVGGLNEGYIPHSSRLDFRDDSKKLLFVVMSRAKEKLIISSKPPSISSSRNSYKVNLEIENCGFCFDLK